MDETLVHYSEEKQTYLIRPGCRDLLSKTKQSGWDIVIFTAATQDYADQILDYLNQPNQIISHRLYRHHTKITKDGHLKDLRNLGRPLEKTLIIDNSPVSF